MKLWIIILSALLPCFAAKAQDSLPPKLSMAGYIKNLQTLNFNGRFMDLVSGNLIHNRINFKWNPSEKITVVTEMRNRFFWGDEIKFPGYSRLLRNDIEALDMQKIWIDNSSVLLHTNIERLFFEYRQTSWNLRLGRQRINWGKTTTWNPNDIFNTYNFLDFDYEERPGADGMKLQYFLNENWNTEIAYVYAGGDKKHIAAVKLATNKWNYDFQVLAGIYHGRLTFGTGWAGYIGEAGFKGEAQYFSRADDSASHLNLSLESDYMFEKGWYVNLGVLYNQRGITGTISSWDFTGLNISPLKLMPTRWNIVAGTTKEITPLLSANVGLLYAPGPQLLIAYPSFQYSLATNLDLNMVWHSFFAGKDPGFDALGQRVFLRIKWSF